MNRPFWSLRPASSENICDSIEPLLSAYADGMASPAETRRIETHLPECEGCRIALSWMQATRTALASRPVVVPPPDLHSRIALAIAASSAAPAMRPARVFTVRIAYAAAASLTALGIALSYPLLHLPGEVSAKHPAKPTVLATAPSPAARLNPAPKTAHPLVASRVIKHATIARKTVPVAVTPPERIAVLPPPTTLRVVPPVAKAPVRHAPPTQTMASRDIVPTEKQSVEKQNVEKRVPLPVVKTTEPKLPDMQKVAKIIKEPLPVPVNIQPTKVTPDSPVVQTASTHEAVSNNPLGPVLVYVKLASHTSLATIRVPAQKSYHEATSVIQEVGNTDQTAFISAVHGNQ